MWRHSVGWQLQKSFHCKYSDEGVGAKKEEESINYMFIHGKAASHIWHHLILRCQFHQGPAFMVRTWIAKCKWASIRKGVH